MSCTEIELKALKANELIAKAVSLVENAQKMVGEIPLSEMKTVRSNDTGLKWTGDIVNLVEMVYGLVEMGCVNEGNVPIEKHTDKFYIRAERYAGLYEKVKRQTGWTTVEIGFQQYDVQSFPFESFEDVKHCRLVVQRQRKQKGEQLDLFDGEYTYVRDLVHDTS